MFNRILHIVYTQINNPYQQTSKALYIGFDSVKANKIYQDNIVNLVDIIWLKVEEDTIIEVDNQVKINAQTISVINL